MTPLMRIKALVRRLEAALTLEVGLVLVLVALAPALSRATIRRPEPTRQQAARCLAALSRGSARAVPGAAPPGVASVFGIFARAPRASDGLPGTVRVSQSLGTLGAAAYYPGAVRLLRRDQQDALYVVPAMLGPRRVRGACRGRLRALAARIVQDPSATGKGLGVCMVETVDVNGDPAHGGHAEAASVACLPLRSVGTYAEILPRIQDARDHEYMLVPDSVTAVGFQFSGHHLRTITKRDGLIELPGPVTFTTGPRAPTLATFSRDLATLLPLRIAIQRTSHPRPFGLVVTLSRTLLDEDRLVALTGGRGLITWRL
jgi:hypothetical protein